jgi:DNA-binding MarR family transcriptional regulator
MDLIRLASDLQELVGVIVRGLAGDRELSISAYGTLGSLDRQGPQRITNLAAFEGTAQPSMTQLVQRLEQQGLVTRASDPSDGRVAVVRLTAHGRAVLHARRKRNTRILAAVLESMPEADVQALADALAAVLPALRAGLGPRAKASIGNGTLRCRASRALSPIEVAVGTKADPHKKTHA